MDNKEIERIQNMYTIEAGYYNNGLLNVAGVDEAGRGPLAGPVVAAAVILPKYCEILYINDSKKLSPKKRESVYAEIEKHAVAISIGIVNSREIDEINIDKATKKAMLIAVQGLSVTPDAVLIDGNRPPETGILQQAIIGGDGKSANIAAASIVAKVMRDKMMVEYGSAFPEYGFEKHKGYGTKAHIEAIGKYGVCAIHRLTFTKIDWL